MKRCSKCKQVKELASFSECSQQKDGLFSHCKQCHSADNKLWKENNPERAKLRWRYNKPVASKAYRKWARNNSAKIKAHGALHASVRSGRTAKPTTCSCCHRVRKLDAHHPDYAKPLEVIWLCHQCHCDLHKRQKQTNGRHQPTTTE